MEDGSPSFVGKILGGPIWRYELEPVDGGTRVRETWDISRVAAPRSPSCASAWSRKDVRKSMEKTLENIEKLLASS